MQPLKIKLTILHDLKLWLWNAWKCSKLCGSFQSKWRVLGNILEKEGGEREIIYEKLKVLKQNKS